MDRKKNNDSDLNMEELLREVCALSPGDLNMLRLLAETQLQEEAAALIAAARARSDKIEDIIAELAEYLRRET